MEKTFLLPVIYQEKELEFSALLVVFGYTYSFHIMVDKVNLVFEKDNENNYRVMNYGKEHISKIKPALLQAIIESLNKIKD